MKAVEKNSVPKFWHDSELGGPSFISADYSKPHTFEPHVHDELVITVTERGAGHAEARNLSDTVSPNVIWVSGAGEYHCGQVIDGERWSYRAFYLDQKALQSIGSAFSQDVDFGLTVEPGIYVDPQLSKMLLALHASIELEPNLLERQNLWWSTMGYLFGRYGEQPRNIISSGKEKSKMAVVRDYIETNHSEDIATERLAALVGLSSYYLIRSFKQEYGLSPHAYANQLKLLAAKKLLINGISAAAVAHEVGFYDQSHLNRFFKRAYGITPHEYKKAFL